MGLPDEGSGCSRRSTSKDNCTNNIPVTQLQTLLKRNTTSMREVTAVKEQQKNVMPHERRPLQGALKLFSISIEAVRHR